ncbi:MAG TPA: hypothetical protein VFS70_17285 [Actinomycetota bacterium]|nr:hypothetical protein [Actinomycetota bacterium]
MPLPTSYTEEALAEFMYRSIDNFTQIFGWTDTTAPPYPDAVNDTLRYLTVGDISEADNMAVLEASARVTIWRSVVRRASTEYDYVSDSQTFYRSQLYKQAAGELAIAEAHLTDAEEATGEGGGGGGTIGVGRFVRLDDPYAPLPALVGYPLYPAYPVPQIQNLSETPTKP